MFPVAYRVLEVESEESWTWFLQNLRDLIGYPSGLVIQTDACKGLETAVEAVFPGVEHRECMRHLVQNFTKKFKGKVFTDNLWPAAYTCSRDFLDLIATYGRALKGYKQGFANKKGNS